MRSLIVLTFFVTMQLTAQQKFFAGTPIAEDRNASAKWTTATVWKDSAGTLVVYDLRVTKGTEDVLIFESGNPFSNTSGILLSNVTQKEAELLLSLKRLFEQYRKADVGLTLEQLENLRVNAIAWLSNKKLLK
jgi:hypothetical protein